MTTVPEHLELQGASGARYRFRRVKDPAALPAEGGNFVYVKFTEAHPLVIACGVGETLHQARDLWPRAVEQFGAEAIFVRLNIARKHRVDEHDDITNAHDLPMKT
jgi:hypothetical protein